MLNNAPLLAGRSTVMGIIITILEVVLERTDFDD